MWRRIKKLNNVNLRLEAAIAKRRVQGWKGIPGNVFDAPCRKHYIKE